MTMFINMCSSAILRPRVIAVRRHQQPKFGSNTCMKVLGCVLDSERERLPNLLIVPKVTVVRPSKFVVVVSTRTEVCSLHSWN